MTEGMDSDSHNLCIPEDTFEQFQAVSMYQEDEYITLSEIAPAKPKEPDPGEMSQLSYDNEVVVTTENEVNSTVGDNTEEVVLVEHQNFDDSCKETNEHTNDGQILSAQDNEPTPQAVSRRGKKKKSVTENDQSISSSMHDSQMNTDLETPLASRIAVPRKRGRKPKPKPAPADPVMPLGMNQEFSNISNTPFSSDPENSDNTVVKKKRGRPKKTSVPNDGINSKVISDLDTSEINSSDNYRNDNLLSPSKLEIRTKGKRGRPRKVSLDIFTENHKNLNLENENHFQINDFNGTKCTDNNIRKSLELDLQKLEQAIPDENHTQNKNKSDKDNKILSQFSDDDLDEISLSKLKNLPDVSKSKDVVSNVDQNSNNNSFESTPFDPPPNPVKTDKKRGRPRKSQTDKIRKLSVDAVDKSEPTVKSSSSNYDTDKVVDVLTDMSSSLSKSMDKTDEAVNAETNNTTEVSTNVVVDLEIDSSSDNINETPTKRSTKIPVMSDFEYNIDSVVDKEITINEDIADNGLLVEDTSKRPKRRKVPKLRYDEGSDEDPFANIELSDDDDGPRRRKGNKYYSDDEYIPGRRGHKDIDSTDSEAAQLLDETKKQKRKKLRKKSDNQSPRKKGKSDESYQNVQSDDIEICLEPAVIKTSDDSQSQLSQAWGSSNEFENFLAKKIHGTNLKIKKLSATNPGENKALEIPVIDPEARKTFEMSSQTNFINTVSTSVQTNVPYDIPMKENITLTSEQSEKACYFLNSIVKTTSELGTLMTQKSEDFIKKKINTTHVTDTMKMDYCVKKSFLLFKLAKHNLMQMEEDLAKQYDEFLKSNNLTACREIQKEVVATAKPASSDSDCEIVEEPVKSTSVKKPQAAKPKFNPKTVFLNKELSIKIAKKPTENKKLDIKGRHTVWINETVMVKKVKPTQSFLAQDSRNKKPPDNIITTEMVSDFFKNYYRQKALSVCAPFITTDWLNVGRECACNYFVVKPTSQFNNDVSYSRNVEISTASHANVPNTNLAVKHLSNTIIVTCPETLLKMCFRIVKNQMNGVCHLKEVCQHVQNELTDGKNQPVTLLRLCLRAMTGKAVNILERSPKPSKNVLPDDLLPTVLPLKTLCHQKIVLLLFNSSQKDYSGDKQSFLDTRCSTERNNNFYPSHSSTSRKNRYQIKSLLSLCVEFIQRKLALEISSNRILIPKSLAALAFEHIKLLMEINTSEVFKPKTLKSFAFEHIKQLLYGDLQIASYGTSHLNFNQYNDKTIIEGLTINSVNTLSEEAFLNLEQSNASSPDSPEYSDNFDNQDHYEPEYSEAEVDNQTEPSWVSQVKMQELRSCINTNPFLDQGEVLPTVTQIKLEPLDNTIENLDSPILVKAEPVAGSDEMTIIPDIKHELDLGPGPGPIQRQDSNSYDVDAFEQFVASNKIMHELNQDASHFSQSALRVHRQHEPDYEIDDMSMSLLVPQTYESLSIENVKGSLMASSSDEGGSKTKKLSMKKKPDKRPKGKQKKPDPKTTNKEAVLSTKEKASSNEVASLTKKMRDRIRQEEKKEDSSDSDTESIPLRIRNRKEIDKSKPVQPTHTKESEIQCSNVDSTDQVDEDLASFTGFTAIDQNEISTYQKYMKYVYDKIIPGKENENSNHDLPVTYNESKKENAGLLIAFNEPVELLECEPTMPIFDDQLSERKSKKSKRKVEEIPKAYMASEEGDTSNKGATSKKEDVLLKSSYTERHGWQCYPINTDDKKLCQNACIALEKLPESFVQTYFEYQGITRKDRNDEEIDRLTNLNSLNRGGQLQNSNKTKIKSRKEGNDENTPDTVNRPESPSFSDQYELEPSDDEGTKVEDEVAPPVTQKHTENTLAKNLLMNDNDSEPEEPTAKVKQEPPDPTKPSKSSKSKKKEDTLTDDSADLMLTADKMMNKELTLLHAPVVPTSDVKNTSTGPVTRNKQKTASKTPPSSSKVKTEEDSSSEEEKQWVTTKEKLLKRMGKKEHTSLDDAKRAKLVSEFIERRADFPDSYKRGRTKSRRSSKKFLERQKQLRVLSRELFGESSDSNMSKRSQKAQASLLYKGRRNIRKVIDKKSLARSTVVANMEEFERKRRLNSRQTKLRELLGCEEGVNVLVINDEVCLEYDFEENRPVVTVHPFFTKVMKAHQYEGVKFMWDACFESLADIEAGHPGGGCILAHCMGLGKTLQVLALLHTVLTHPGVKMQRVLVCCPLSTVLNWVDEIHKWIGPVTNQIKVFELSKLKKTYERAYQLEDWYNGGGIFIIGYELFRSLTTLDPFLDDVRPTIINKIRTALLDPGPDIIVCDEGHLLKNDCSVLAVAMSRVITKRRIILTGTPMQNNLREYYCMVNFVKPNLLGTYSEYSNRFENPIMNGQHRDSREEDIKLMKARTHILHKVLEGCLQRQEASVLYPYLPKKYEYTVFISLTQCQWELYKHYLNNYGKQSKQSILKDFHILQKIWSHPQALHNFQTKAREREDKNKIKAEKVEDDLATEDVEDIKPSVTEDLWWLEYLEAGKMLETLDSSNKFVVVFRILDECVALGDKVLIFSTSLFCLDALEYFLKKINKWSLGNEYFRLDGSVPAEVRQNWCREFNSDSNYKTKLFLVSTRAGCLGLNMTAANRVIIMDTSWNPAHDIQSIFRVYRFGQKKDCYIYRLVAMGTMEQKIYERSVTKQAVACRVVDEQQIDRHYNMAELTELYKFDEGLSCVAGGVAAGVRDVALLRVARDAAAALHAVHEHDSLLRGSSEQGLPEHERNAAWMQFQQEHAHKQMENKLVINIPNVPKVSLKRMHGHDYTLATPPETAVKTEDTSHDNTTSEPKVKKGKKSVILKCNIPIQEEDKQTDKMAVRRSSRKNLTAASPSTSKDIIDNSIPPKDPDETKAAGDEELMVEKITDILIKYNFQNKKGNAEISKLVSKIRSMVKKGYVDDKDMLDDMTASIAKVLMPNQLGLGKVTDIMCESINNSAAPNAKTSGECPEVITSDPTPGPVFTRHENLMNEPALRTRRKAALAAEKSMDSIAQDVIINIDDDDGDLRDTDFVPDKQHKSQKTQNVTDKSKNKSKNSSLLKSVDSDDSTLSASPPPENYIRNDDFNTTSSGSNSGSGFKLELKTTKQTYGPKKCVQNLLKDRKENQSKNIAKIRVKAVVDLESAKSTSDRDKSKNEAYSLLSDDEEPSTSYTKPAEKPAQPAAAISKPPEKPDDSEVVPLPTSLLKNQNFINIVAHTYLVGNPMLDEDAATLAAQYSTLKALKEAERTGEDVCSGPIYDIAVKVIGKEILKKMQSVNPKAASSSANDAAASIKRREKMIAAEKYSKEQDNSSRSFGDDLIMEKLGLPKSTAAKLQAPIVVNLTGSTASNAGHLSPSIVVKPTSSMINKVVPVGLIKTVPSISTSQPFGASRLGSERTEPRVECILPDDDDVIISDVRATPVPGTAPSPPERAKIPVLKKKGENSEPKSSPQVPFRVIVGNSASAPVSQTKPIISIKTHKPTPTLVLNTPLVGSSGNIPAVQVIPNDVTICLDSDEEETITPTFRSSTSSSQQAPVPISLTVAKATGNTSQQLPHQTLVLRQVVTSSGTQTRYILVPAENSPVPILPKPPMSDNPKVYNTKITSAQPAPLKTQPPTQSTSQTMLSNSTITSRNTDIANKTPWRPGDVIRLSKTGVIEVINRNDVSMSSNTNSAPVEVTSVISQPKSAASKPLTSQLFAPNPEVAKSKTATKQNKTHRVDVQRVRRISSSSSNSSSRSDSPDNPLSILQNVVQIQAVNYQTHKNTNNTKSDGSLLPEETNKCNVSVEHVVSSELSSSPTNVATSGVIKLTKISKDKVPKHIDTAVEKKIKNDALIKKITPLLSKNQPTAKEEPKARGKNTISFDSLNSATTSKILKGTGKTTDKKGSSSSSKAPITVDLTHLISDGTTVIKSKRQSSSSEVTPAKRKRNQPMTLKDFNLDDIDDIIELE